MHQFNPEEKINIESETIKTPEYQSTRNDFEIFHEILEGEFSRCVELTSITPEVAKVLMTSTEPIYLHHLRYIPDEAMYYLSKLNESLYLPAYTNPTNQSLEYLSQHKQAVNLDGITNLNVEQATILKKHIGTLELGLKNIDIDVAKELAEHKGTLVLYSITEMSEEVAKIFSSHEGKLILGLETITPEVAFSLALHENEIHIQCENIDDESMRNLAKHKGSMYLNELKELSVNAAQSLANLHEGDLHMYKLYDISEEAAKILVNHRGNIYTSSSSHVNEKIDGCRKRNYSVLDMFNLPEK